jgi:hypothetical protein
MLLICKGTYSDYVAQSHIHRILKIVAERMEFQTMELL